MVKKRKYPEDWGENLYHVSVVKSVDDSGELFIYADYTEIGNSGELNFITILGDDEIETTVTLQSAQWKMCFIVDQNDENFGVPLNIIDRPPIEEIKEVEEEVQSIQNKLEDEVETTQENVVE